MINWWDWDNANSTVVADIRGGHDGIYQNGASAVSGFICNSLILDGVDDYLLIADHDDLTFSDGISDKAFSIEAWIYLENGSTSHIFNKGGYNSREYNFRITGTLPGHLAFAIYDDRRPTGGNSNAIGLRSVRKFDTDLDTWIHVAVTYDGTAKSSGMKLYRNGVALPTYVLVGTDSLGTNYQTMQNQSEGATIGRFHTDFNRFYKGQIDELSLYDRALTPAEISSIYSAGNNGKCSDPTLDNDTTECHGLIPPPSPPCNLKASFSFNNECLGEKTVLSNTSVPYGTNWQWKISDGSSFIGVSDTVYEFKTVGNYQVTLITSIDSITNCVDSVVKELIIIDTPTVDLGFDTIICKGKRICYEYDENDITYFWNDSIENDTFCIKSGGLYKVAAQNTCGFKTDSILVEIEDCSCNLFYPNTITPNDDELNDQFEFVTQCPDIESFTIFIYNRWGHELFTSNDINFKWPESNDQVLPDGMYVFRFELNYLEKNDLHTIKKIDRLYVLK